MNNVPFIQNLNLIWNFTVCYTLRQNLEFPHIVAVKSHHLVGQKLSY